MIVFTGRYTAKISCVAIKPYSTVLDKERFLSNVVSKTLYDS